MTQQPKNSPNRRHGDDRRSGADRRSSNQPQLIRLIDRLEAIKESLSEKEHAALDSEARDADQDVKLKLEFECSEGFARDLVGGIAYLLQEKSKGEQLRDPPEELHYIKDISKGTESDEGSPPENHLLKSPNNREEETSWVCPTRPRKISSALLIILLTVATVMGGFQLLAYKNRKASELVEARQVRKNQQLYKQYLAANLDILLSKLDQLTATPKMGRVFPEITSMSAIARFKRGPEAADKAETAKDFIYRVKEIFDNWVKRANDFFPEERPGKKEITHFLSVWNDTETILNQLEAAKNDPSIAAKTIAQ